MKTYEWYAALRKPRWASAPGVFGPVWTVLYAVNALTFGIVFLRTYQGVLPWQVALPFAINLVANALFTPLQFGLRSNRLAAADILVVLASLVWAMVAVQPLAPWIAYLQVPYLLWVCFAACLQLTITFLNP